MAFFLIFNTCVEVWPNVEVPPNNPPEDEVVAPKPLVPPNKDGCEVVVAPKPNPYSWWCNVDYSVSCNHIEIRSLNIIWV